jgi:hypothetical protein
LPWAQIDNGINSIGNAPLAPHVAAALARVRALSERARATSSFEVTAAGTNKVQLVRDFGGGAREQADVAFHGEIDTGAFFVSYGAGYRTGQVGPDYHFEPGYVAVKSGNWAAYVGFTEVWFGPGNDGTLLFSNSARPFPKIGIRRLSPDPLNIPILKWLGPVKVEAFAGILNEQRDYRNPLVMGMRVAFEPTPGLEIGLHRAIQMCGSDRPCNARSFGKAWFGLGNADNIGSGGNLSNDPGNQLAGFDLSYARMIGNVTAKAYFEALAEDRRNLSLAHYARLGGVQASGPRLAVGGFRSSIDGSVQPYGLVLPADVDPADGRARRSRETVPECLRTRALPPSPSAYRFHAPPPGELRDPGPVAVWTRRVADSPRL